MHQYTVEAIYMAAICNLRSNYMFVQADVTVDLLSSSVLYFFHIFPLALTRYFKKMALNLLGKLCHIYYYP